MPEVTTTENVLADLNARIRVLEEKQNILREKLLIINQNMLEEYKRLIQEIKIINIDLRDSKEEIVNNKDMTKHFIMEMENFARKENLLVLEKYIKLWDPMKFVTEDEVLKLVQKRGK